MKFYSLDTDDWTDDFEAFKERLLVEAHPVYYEADSVPLEPLDCVSAECLVEGLVERINESAWDKYNFDDLVFYPSADACKELSDFIVAWCERAGSPQVCEVFKNITEKKVADLQQLE